MSRAALAARFADARAGRGDEVVLEGFHAVKHAVRFGGEPDPVLTTSRAGLRALAAELAPDVAAALSARAQEADLAELVPHVPPTAVVALARRPAFDAAAALATRRDAFAVLLEDPRALGNVGAVVRVAAAADAAAVLTTGTADPWAPAALRGSAGLHFALPVGRVEDPLGPLGGRPLVALDPDGDPIGAEPLPAGAVLAVGTERHGLSPGVLARAAARVAIPMRAGVSSLNLATAVAVVLLGGTARAR